VVSQASAETWKEAIPAATAGVLKGMMIDVVAGGTGTAAGIPGVKVAGKTGTAQAGASGNNTLAWFVAFAPADSPRIALAVLVESAGNGTSETGGKLAAPIAKAVLTADRAVAGW